MRRKVPFIGEEHIARSKDEQAKSKMASGNLIDDVLSTYAQPSSWDDHVKDYVDPLAAPTKAVRQRPHAAIAKPVRTSAVPISPGPLVKKSASESYVGTSSIDWLPINNGHGLRINICGSLDQHMRSEWTRLLEETASNGVGQFEFNLTQAPSLSLTGLGMLLLFKEQKGSERGDIKLCHCNKDVWQMLQWTGMDKYFIIQAIPGMDI